MRQHDGDMVGLSDSEDRLHTRMRWKRRSAPFGRCIATTRMSKRRRSSHEAPSGFSRSPLSVIRRCPALRAERANRPPDYARPARPPDPSARFAATPRGQNRPASHAMLDKQANRSSVRYLPGCLFRTDVRFFRDSADTVQISPSKANPPWRDPAAHAEAAATGQRD